MTFREPKTWQGSVDPTDLNREVRDQFRSLRAALTALEVAGPSTGVLPLGYIMGYAGINVPTSWLVCDGQLVSKGLYPDLYDFLWTLYWSDTATTFPLPDFRERFLRGVNSAGDGTVNSRGAIGGYATNTLTLTTSGLGYASNGAATTSDGGSHTHTFNTQHSHNYNHSSNAYGFNNLHAHNNNDHAHGGATTNSGGGNSGTGNLGTCTSHAHNQSNSNSYTHASANTYHTGDIGNNNVTLTTVGHSSQNTTGTDGAHTHNTPHLHYIDHSHVVANKLPEYDDVNWLINYNTDTPENWFIAGSAILGTSMIGV